MSIKKWRGKIVAWFTNSSIISRIMWTYVLCGILPMLVIIAVYYQSTVRLTLNQAYDRVEQNLNIASSGLSYSMERYQALMDMLMNDSKLNTQLNLDYSDKSYSDLSYHLEDKLEPMLLMYPELERVRFYNDNRTLPRDQFYFFSTEDLNTDVAELLDRTEESMVAVNNWKDRFSFLCGVKLHSYSDLTEHSYLIFQISQSVLRSHLMVEDENSMMVLLDSQGQVMLDSEGNRMYRNIREFLPDWDDIRENTIGTPLGTDDKYYISMKKNVGNNLTLLMLVDRDRLLSRIRMLPLGMLSPFVLMLIIFIFLVLHQNRSLDRKLKMILTGIDAVGSGDFRHKIQLQGENELGVIAREVNHMGDQLDELIKENYRRQLIIQSTELNLLQEQINPHFLYNALAVISSLAIREQGKQTVQSIRFLADFYRVSLNKGRKVLTVREEIGLLENYMKIQLLRFSDLVEIHYQVEPEVEEFYTIKLLLQPLVENAIHHAREEEMFLSIQVKAYGREDRVCFDVEDNGRGIEPEKLRLLQEALLRQEEGFGLKNVDKRIKLAYGQEYGVSVFSAPDSGTRIHLEIPKITGREEGGAV